MKKKLKFILPAFLIVAVMIFVQPVRSFALDVLNVFRVSDVKTVKITVTDMQEAMNTLKTLETENADLIAKHQDAHANGVKAEAPHSEFVNLITKDKPEVKQLESAKDFKAFKLRLPQELESQKPVLSAVDPFEIKFSLNVDPINDVLKLLKSKPLSSDLNKVEMSVQVPGSVVAKYDDLLFFATQKPALQAPENAKKEIHNLVVNSPLIPTNIRTQLAEIDIDSSDVYLPVLVGVGREVDLGGRMGYIYTMSDLKNFTNTNIPAEMKNKEQTHDTAKMEELKAKHEAELTDAERAELAKFQAKHEQMIKDMPNMENASVLIWTKDGVIYGLVGDKTDTELSEIARSVH